jgi:hypothetical protein
MAAARLTLAFELMGPRSVAERTVRRREPDKYADLEGLQRSVIRRIHERDMALAAFAEIMAETATKYGAEADQFRTKLRTREDASSGEALHRLTESLASRLSKEYA